MNEPRRIGSYLEVDDSGRLIGRGNAHNIKRPWSQVVDAVVAAYLERFEGDIHSIYLRGSLAAGLAIEGVSDVDSFAVLKSGASLRTGRDELHAWEREVDERLRSEHPFVDGVEVLLLPFDQATKRGDIFSFILATESACLYGPDLTQEVASYEVGPQIAYQTRFFGRDLEHFEAEYPTVPPADRSDLIVWILRRFLRLGMELVMTEEKRYTRDLFLCYESFSKYYPERSTQMRRALELALNPEASEESVAFIGNFGSWLRAESERRLLGWGYERDAEGLWTR